MSCFKKKKSCHIGGQSKTTNVYTRYIMYTKRIYLILLLYLTNKEEVILLYYFTRSLYKQLDLSGFLFILFACHVKSTLPAYI